LPTRSTWSIPRFVPFQAHLTSCCFTCRGLIRQVRSFKNEFLACKKIPVPAVRNERDMVRVCVSGSRPVRRSRADATGLAPKKSASQNPLCVSQVVGLWQRVLPSSRFFWRSLGAEALDHIRRRQPGRFCPASLLLGSSWASGLPSRWHPFGFRSAKIWKTSLANSCRGEIG
jgi:hypothetical protein